MRLPHPPLLVITDRRAADRPLTQVVEAALAGGCRWLMVREKDLPAPALAGLVRGIAGLARPLGAAISVNGDATVAAACDADGVHLPQGCDVAAARRAVGDAALVGVSAHSLDEARAARAAGADYVTLSPIFPSASKPGYGPALGLEGLAHVASAAHISVIALGGVDASNAGACLAAGARGVAVLGAVMRASDPSRAASELRDALDTAV